MKSNQSSLSSDGGMIERLPGGGGQCLVCGRAFSGLRNAKRHYNTVHLQENSPCRCPVCKKTFLRKELMKDHLRRKHKMYKDMYKSLLGTSASGSGPSKAAGAGPSLQVLQSTTSAAPKWPTEAEGGPLSVLRPETVLHEGPHQLLGSGGPLQVQQRPVFPPKWQSENEVEGGPLSVLRPETVLHEGPHHSLMSVSDPNISTSPNSVQVKNEPLENSDADQ